MQLTQLLGKIGSNSHQLVNIVSDHAGIKLLNRRTLNSSRLLRCKYKMIVTMRTVRVGFGVKVSQILAERLATLFANQSHVHRLLQSMVLAFLVARRTVKELPTTNCAHRNLSFWIMRAHE